MPSRNLTTWEIALEKRIAMWRENIALSHLEWKRERSGYQPCEIARNLEDAIATIRRLQRKLEKTSG
jgi:hypothetical protein